MFLRLTLGGLAALAMAVGSLGLAVQSASAEVVYEATTPTTLTLDNRCEGQTGSFLVEGFAHWVWYTTPEGHTMMRGSGHYKGTASDGTQYVARTSRTMEHDAWPAFAPFTDVVVFQLLSNGPTPNSTLTVVLEYSAVFVAPFNPPYVVSVTCTG